MNTIEELYYGNITPAEREYRRSNEYAHVLQLATRNEEKLTEDICAELPRPCC